METNPFVPFLIDETKVLKDFCLPLFYKGLGFGGWGGGGFWFPGGGGGVGKPKAKNRHWLPKHKNEKSKKSIKDKKTNSSKDLVPKKGKVRTTKDLVRKNIFVDVLVII